MATITVVLGDPPYGKQRVYTALRFSLVALHEGHQANLFLLEDAVFAAKRGRLEAGGGAPWWVSPAECTLRRERKAKWRWPIDL
jgi:predicted peroxiredoxin